LSRPTLSAAASTLAGVALLVGAPHAFGSVGSGVPVGAGAVEIEATGVETAASGHSGGELVVVPGETVTFTATARATVRGEGLSAVLRLDTGELFAVAPEPLRDDLQASTHVELEGLAPVAGTDDTWLLPARERPYDVEAVVTVTMPDLTGVQGRPLSNGTLSWSLTQVPSG
jgi:alternate signal-mediated exported protein